MKKLKKIVSIVLICALVLSIFPSNVASASKNGQKNNYKKLATYISKHGKKTTNSSTGKVEYELQRSSYFGDSVITYIPSSNSIMYESANGYEAGTTYMGIELNLRKMGKAKITFMIVTSNSQQVAKGNIDLSSIATENDTISFKNYSFKETSLRTSFNKVAISVLDIGMMEWKKIIKRTGLSMSDLGFTLYGKKVKLNKKKATLEQGDKLKLKVKGTGQKVKWSSNKKWVATVSSRGIVKAKSSGTAKITAKVGLKKIVCKVTVKSGENTSNPEETPAVNTSKEPLTISIPYDDYGKTFYSYNTPYSISKIRIRYYHNDQKNTNEVFVYMDGISRAYYNIFAENSIFNKSAISINFKLYGTDGNVISSTCHAGVVENGRSFYDAVGFITALPDGEYRMEITSPTVAPTKAPTVSPTTAPTKAPTVAPTKTPSVSSTSKPLPSSRTTAESFDVSYRLDTLSQWNPTDSETVTITGNGTYAIRGTAVQDMYDIVCFWMDAYDLDYYNDLNIQVEAIALQVGESKVYSNMNANWWYCDCGSLNEARKGRYDGGSKEESKYYRRLNCRNPYNRYYDDQTGEYIGTDMVDAFGGEEIPVQKDEEIILYIKVSGMASDNPNANVEIPNI